jgi:hypothetical protein
MTFTLDFSSLGKGKESSAPGGLLETFNQLDRKASHESLRVAQNEALAAMNNQRDHRDVVLKLSTGAGKTVIGLVWAEYMRLRYAGEPVVFLCTTRQLVTQVCHSAQMIGVPVEEFPEKGLPYSALDGRAVLVCTYDKIFNGRSVFESNDIRPAAIVMDDVHAGIDRVEQTFTVTAPTAAYPELKKLLEGSCSSVDPGMWRAIQNNEFDARFEVPYWIYQNCQASVFDILEAHKDTTELRFNLPNMRRYGQFCRLCITGTKVELAYYVPPVEEIQSFEAAKHRLFMSASIKDGGALIRDLGCGEEALRRVIEPTTDRGVGERMIIPISLVDASTAKTQVAELCREFAKMTNVVVLCSTHRQALIWVEQGAQLVTSDVMEPAIDRLRATNKGNFLVFAQRFDGLDLADEACRILVLDGVPSGERICDAVDKMRQRAVPAHYIDAVNKFEQALGRAVRSSADFAAVLLVGHELASFIGRKAVKDYLEPLTLKQIEVGKDIAAQLAGSGQSLDGVTQAVRLLLSRDPGWKEGHRQALSTIAKSIRPAGHVTENEHVAHLERQAWLAAKSRKLHDARDLLRAAVDSAVSNKFTQAELYYRMAGYLQFIDPGQALAVHHQAFSNNTDLPRPVEMPSRRYLKVTEQSTNIAQEFSSFTSANAAIAEIECLKAKLSYSHSADSVEQALLELGTLLGADASRPEKETNRGPDVLWRFPDLTFCIEAKSEKTAPIHKDDAKQLLLSRQWCVDTLGVQDNQIVCVFATNMLGCDREEDISFGPKVLTEASAIKLADALKSMVAALSFDGPLFSNNERIAGLIGPARLTAGGIQTQLATIK